VRKNPLHGLLHNGFTHRVVVSAIEGLVFYVVEKSSKDSFLLVVNKICFEILLGTSNAMTHCNLK
jgi:hypothetical protein